MEVLDHAPKSIQTGLGTTAGSGNV